MKTSRHAGLRRKKRLNQIRAGLLAAIVLLFLWFGYYWILVPCIFLIVLNDLLKADHIFYSPQRDYAFTLAADVSFAVTLRDCGQIQPATEISGNSNPDNRKPGSPGNDNAGEDRVFSWWLPVQVRGTAAGRILDPYVEITCEGYCNRLYFERGVSGRRYLDLTPALAGDVHRLHSVQLKFRHCSASCNSAELQGFCTPDFSGRRLLIVAPHADDAEIAAFGLYSRATDAHIVTITAGEVQAQPFEPVCAGKAQASRLKGRLRALDSVAVPLWGGVRQDRCINLGYFCLTLQQMHDAPDKPVVSRTAEITDPRFFRAFNAYRLRSDTHGQATWQALIQDLREIIERVRPEVVVTCHPDLDPHEDHIYATKAVREALTGVSHLPGHLLYYANHYTNTDMHPFGPGHTLTGLPPVFEYVCAADKVYSQVLSRETQRDKAFALRMMHDLQTKPRFKKMRRAWLQSLLLRRSLSPYGRDDYFRKAVRENEVFFVERLKA